jgi:hypothetical protein
MSPLESYARFLTRHAWLVLVAVASTVVLAGTRRLRAEFNVEASLPAGHEFVRIDRRSAASSAAVTR